MIRFIMQEYDIDDYGIQSGIDHSTGFGFCVDSGYGREIRVAVKIKNSATIDDFKKLWKILAEAIADPKNPKFKAAIGHSAILYNKEIILEEYELEKAV